MSYILATGQHEALPTESSIPMPAIVCSVAAFTVASIFYAWRSQQEVLGKRERQLRDRVAHMLWVMVNQA